MHRHTYAATIVLSLLLATPATALIMVGKGNDPVNDAGWPVGSLELANQKTRVGYWEGPPFGGGQTCFLYRGDTAALEAAVKAFAGIRAPALKLVVHAGPQNSQFIADPKDPKADTHYDWSFTVWNPASWHRLFNDPRTTFMADSPNFHKPVDPPQLDVYVTDRIDWKKITVPDGITVIDERAAEGPKAAAGAVIRGDVFDMATGKPIPDAEVRVERQPKQQRDAWDKVASGAANAAGRFEVTNIPAGNFRIVAAAKGYAPRVLKYEEFRDGVTQKLAVELSKLATLRGVILDTDNKPIPGVKVRASNVMAIDGRGYNGPDPEEVTTDQQGAFILGQLPTGYAQVWAIKPGWYHVEPFKLFDLPPSRPGLTIQMVQTGAIKGKVVAANGKPANGSINVSPPGDPIGKWGGSTNLNADGTFEFKDVPPGPYTVSTRPDLPGVTPDPNAQHVTVVSGKTLEVTVKQ